MTATIEAPIQLVQAIAYLRFPPKTDHQMQLLMDANTNGTITPSERCQLESFVELSESLALLRCEALRLLGEQPK